MSCKLTIKLALALLVSGGIASAQPQLITFDDLPTIPGGGSIPDGYKGFDWNTFNYLDVATFNGGADAYLAVSMPNIAINAYGGDAYFYSAGGGTFDLTSAYLTGEYGDQNVEVKGFGPNNILLYDNIYQVFAAGPTLITFDYNGITEVYLHSEIRSQIAIDNISINGGTVPDGGTTCLLFSGALLGLGLLRRKLA